MKGDERIRTAVPAPSTDPAYGIRGCLDHEDDWGLAAWTCVECGCRHRWEVSRCHCGELREGPDA